MEPSPAVKVCVGINHLGRLLHIAAHASSIATEDMRFLLSRGVGGRNVILVVASVHMLLPKFLRVVRAGGSTGCCSVLTTLLWLPSHVSQWRSRGSWWPG